MYSEGKKGYEKISSHEIPSMITQTDENYVLDTDLELLTVQLFRVRLHLRFLFFLFTCNLSSAHFLI